MACQFGGVIPRGINRAALAAEQAGVVERAIHAAIMVGAEHRHARLTETESGAFRFPRIIAEDPRFDRRQRQRILQHQRRLAAIEIAGWRAGQAHARRHVAVMPRHLIKPDRPAAHVGIVISEGHGAPDIRQAARRQTSDRNKVLGLNLVERGEGAEILRIVRQPQLRRHRRHEAHAAEILADEIVPSLLGAVAQVDERRAVRAQRGAASKPASISVSGSPASSSRRAAVTPAGPVPMTTIGSLIATSSG